MKKFIFLSMTVILVILTACTPKVIDGMMIASGSVLRSDNTRLKATEPAADDRLAFAEDNAAFALDLYRNLKTEDGNLFFSPYSVSAALAMTWAGASGNTASQMAETMHFELAPEKLHPAFNWLEREFASRSEGGEEDFSLEVTNAIWGQKDYKFMKNFLDILAENYGAGLRITDFIGNSDESRITINDWVSEQTDKKIQELLAPGSITPDTRLVLTNAVYFKAPWRTTFLISYTAESPFYLVDGSVIDVPMMRGEMTLNYMEGDNYQAIELPYLGDDASMLILLPDEGNFSEFESGLDYQKVSAIVDGLEEKHFINFTMPKFRFESGFSLKGYLAAMGMPDAFMNGKADFSGMTGSKELYIDDVEQKAFISVDERGTEATAATAVLMYLGGGRLTIDRPFIFFIRDIETGTILFMGRVLNPAA